MHAKPTGDDAMVHVPISRRIILFLGTISPAIILFGLVAMDPRFWPWWIVVAIGIGLLILPLRLVHEARAVASRVYVINETRHATPDLTGFLLSYLLPLVVINFADLDSLTEWVPVMAIVLLIGVIYSAGNLVHVQPIYFFGSLRVYECKIANEWHYILASGRLTTGENRLHELSPGLLVSPKTKK